MSHYGPAPKRATYYRSSGASLSRKHALYLRRRLIFILTLALIGLLLLKSGSILHLFSSSQPAKKYLGSVCLDPGHGGDDTGAINQDLLERDLNLRVALRVQSILQSEDYRVYMTRTSNDQYLTNDNRVTFCNDTKANLLVAIHQNYFTDNVTDYTMALYYNQNSRGLAASLANATAARLGTENDGISRFNDGELMRAQMPAALIEGLFISSDQEYAQISETGSVRLAVEAEGIADGIRNFFKNPNQQPTQETDLNQAGSPG